MSDPRPARVRVTGPPRRRQQRSRIGEIDEQTPLGTLYLGSLLRAQFGSALRVLVALALIIGLLPLVFWWFPEISSVRLFGVPLPWWLLGVGAYPLLLGLGWWYVRRAERTERDFADITGDLPDGGRHP